MRKIIFVPPMLGLHWIGREECRRARDHAKRILHEIMRTPERGIPVEAIDHPKAGKIASYELIS